MISFIEYFQSLYILLIFKSAAGDPSRGGLYSTVRLLQNGTNLCITDAPSAILEVSSYTQCAGLCSSQNGCYDFNVISVGTGRRIGCQLYVTMDPLHYGARPGCYGYQREGKSCQSVSAAASSGYVPASCCSIPFTVDGIIYYGCVTNASSYFYGGCLTQNRQLVTCFMPDYTAQYSSSSMVMPGNTRIVIPVLSVNSWITVQNRVANRNFVNQNWLAFRNGFGNASLDDNYWIGNEIISQLTSSVTYSLRVEVQRSPSMSWQSAEYSTFSVDTESSKYVMHVTGYTGDAGDAGDAVNHGNKYWSSNGIPFSTWDNDNDGWPTNNCAVLFGGWWHKYCSTSSLTVDSTAIWSISQPVYDVVSSHVLFRAIQ